MNTNLYGVSNQWVWRIRFDFLCNTVNIRLRKMGQVQTKEFSLLCWNIFGLDNHFLRERTLAICELVKEKKPDVVYFQEVIPATWDTIKHELGAEYSMYRHETVRCHYFHNLMVRNGSAVVLAKEGVTADMFPGTGQGRHLLKAPTTFNDIRIQFMTSHLESLPTDREERKKQLKSCFDIMKELEKTSMVTIFGGDLNLEDSELDEIGGKPENIRDAWEVCGSDKNHELTWHTDNPTRRIDRMYYCPGDGKLQPTSLELVGKDKLVKCGVLPSDHYGLFIKFQIQGPAQT